MLEENNIPTPNHIMIYRGEVINNDNLKEDPNDIQEIEKMIYQYTELVKEMKEENKRKNTKRGDSLIEIKEFSGNRHSSIIQEEKLIEAPSVSSLSNLEENYFEIKNNVSNNCKDSKKSISQKKLLNFNLLPQSTTDDLNLSNKNSFNKSKYISEYDFVKSKNFLLFSKI